jgi:sulfite reductase alpha subunit-like flavoprotein
MPLGTGDECAEGGLEGELEAWYPEFFKSSNIPAPDEEQAPREPTYQVTYSQSAVMKPEQVTDFVDRFYIKQGAAKVSCVGNKLMTDEEYAKSDLRDFRHFRFDCPALSYELGDSLEIYASNDLEITQAFLSAYSPDTDPRAVVNVKSEHPGVQGEVTLECLFQHVFDVFGKPDKKFFGNLAMCAEDAAQKTTLQDMSQGFGEKYEAFVKSTKTFADALLEFDSARPPLPVLFDMLPLIKPRAYSIASAPSMHGDVIELCVVINQWRADQVRTGLCTNYMRQFEQGTKLYAKIKPSSMDPPEVTQPVVAVGIGSGLAPHMCFLYDRVKAARDGETVEEFHLYFGNRRGDKEYLYREELEGFEKEFDWFKLNVAFSRDDPNNRVYVQHLVEQDVECYKQLVEKKGMLYVCGNRNLPKPLQGALVKCFMKANPELDEAGAKAKMEEMFVKGRAQQEVW